ncbi:MAG: hypothetical protein U5J99_14045 [Parvularculaceae bacterium]|nr:hypothetical protein [Parvularculaceae bacterium]
MLMTPVAVSLFAFLALIAGTLLFFAVERRAAAVQQTTEPQR